jgi:hypothetical protein
VTHTYNPSYSGGRDQENCTLKPAQVNISQDPVSKNRITKNWAGGVAQEEDPEFNPQYGKKTKQKNRIMYKRVGMWFKHFLVHRRPWVQSSVTHTHPFYCHCRQMWNIDNMPRVSCKFKSLYSFYFWFRNSSYYYRKYCVRNLALQKYSPW